MHKKEHRSAKSGAIALNVFAAAAIALMSTRYVQLRSELVATNHSLVETRSRVSSAVSNRLALPPNRRLTVCNGGDVDATISAVTANYIDGKGKPATYNSAGDDGRTWTIAARSRLTLDAMEASGTPWDGSVIFYAMDVVSAGKSQLLAGTSEDLKDGCIRLSAGKFGDRE